MEAELWAVKAALAAAKAENEVLLRQLTRLCVYVEQTSGRDPVEIMHTDEFNPTADAQSSRAVAAAVAAGKAASAAGKVAKSLVLAPTPPPPAEEEGDDDSLYGWFSKKFLGAKQSSDESQQSPPPSGVEEEESDDEPLDPLFDDGEEELEDPDAFVCRADADDLRGLEDRLLRVEGVGTVRLNGGSLTRLPTAAPMWRLLSKSLTSLSINDNQVVELPAALGRCQLLRTLRLKNNLMRALPHPVLQLRYLRELDASQNRLSGLPDGFGSLRKLVRLFLSSNEITYLPASLGKLRRLQQMDLSDNALHELPYDLGKLISLRKLWLAKNSLQIFPQQLCALSSIQILDLTENMVTEIPKGVAFLPKLAQLALAGNPLIFPPLGVIEAGDTAAVEYLRRHRYSDLTSSKEGYSATLAASRERIHSKIRGELDPVSNDEPEVNRIRSRSMSSSSLQRSTLVTPDPSSTKMPTERLKLVSQRFPQAPWEQPEVDDPQGTTPQSSRAAVSSENSSFHLLDKSAMSACLTSDESAVKSNDSGVEATESKHRASTGTAVSSADKSRRPPRDTSGFFS
ncbi:hypothetical protein AB1Y20_019315 [Prymnesium parvum]|uniref:Uncharacterized protein n=1 Tax=Prymnesium parvum TaxID=97485 RepID=A0AB34JSD2_PRYPA